jgi:hypothetical protein
MSHLKRSPRCRGEIVHRNMPILKHAIERFVAWPKASRSLVFFVSLVVKNAR